MSWRRKISRLIDVDALIDYLGFDNTEEEREKNIGEIVTLDVFDKQPTAFDVDKVAESLMNRFRVVYNDEDLEWNRAIDYAIKIVKGGGDEC
ncbi:MAG: hypothetical protein MRZ75_06900 [Roseburia sp.]|nr:hypothetical protein [Roseburia sp.]MCI7322802.1 hypothetical protein [Lachnospiraceae bacterium]